MKVQYKNTFVDLAMFNAYHLPRMRVMQAIILFSIILLSRSVCTAWQTTETPVYVLIVGLLITALCVLLLITLLTFIGVMTCYLPGFNKAIYAEHILYVSDTYFVEETAFNRTEHRWSGITKIVQNQNYIFVYVTQISAYVIPKRAFYDNHEAVEFYKMIHSLWRVAVQH